MKQSIKLLKDPSGCSVEERLGRELRRESGNLLAALQNPGKKWWWFLLKCQMHGAVRSGSKLVIF